MKIKANYYATVLYRIFIVYILFILCRIIFWTFNRSLFPEMHSGDWIQVYSGGLKFDTAAMFYFNALPLVMMMLPLPYHWRINKGYQKAVKILFIICNSLAILLNCIDIIYYRFTLRRTTFAVFDEFKHEANISQLFKSFLIDFWYVDIVFLLLVLLLIFLYNRVAPKEKKPSIRPAVYYTSAALLFIITIVLAVGGIRGDFKHSTRPITISNAGDYVENPNEIYLVLNTPFTFIRTIGVKNMNKVSYYDDSTLNEIYTPIHTPDPSNVFEKKNVVLIILESFGKENMGFYNKDLDGGKYKGYTPFLDSLAGQSKIFWNSFANGRKSIDAIPSLVASIPSGYNPFVLTPYVSDTIEGLAHVLKKEGYNTSFFHGAPNGSMGFSAMVKLLGIDHYYGKNEFNNDAEYDGIWGIWDEPFFQFFDQKLNTFKQPFFSTIFSVSSHHPFKVPAKYKNVFPKGPLPVQECIGYTDMALRKFFAKAQQQPWFKNTLFVISADHATVTYHKEYQTPWGEYAIPILLYAPGDPNFKGIDKNGSIQQIDVMPTVLSYLHYNRPFFAYGQNALDSAAQSNAFAFQYSGEYRWIQGDFELFSDGNHVREMYNYKNDRLYKNNLLKGNKTYTNIADSLNRRLKAFIQQYNNRLIDNKLKADSK